MTPEPIMTEWIRQERGWYTSELGGICLEDSGRWFFWPSENNPLGPFNSLAQAKREAELTRSLSCLNVVANDMGGALRAAVDDSQAATP